MESNEFNIEQLEAYINGELTARESLKVEELIATNEQYRDVYQGLLIAEEQSINLDEKVAELASQLTTRPSQKQTAKVVQLFDWKRWGTVAAAVAGIVLVGVTSLKLMDSLRPTVATNASYKAAEDDFDGDQIQIIDPRYTPKRKVQNFEPNVTRSKAELSKDVERVDQVVLNDAENRSNQVFVPRTAEVETQIIHPENIEIIQVADKGDSYGNLLDKLGYKQVRYNPNVTVFNTTRGANSSTAMTRSKIVKHCFTEDGLNNFKKKYEKDYIARFPFVGLVEAELTINEKAEVQDFSIIQSPSEEASKVVIELLEEHGPWQPAINEQGKQVQEKVKANVHFGNTIYIRLEPTE